MKQLSYSLILILTLAACSNKSTRIVKRHLDTTYISMVTSPCFGACPVYTIEVKGNGFAFLEARQFMEFEGAFKAEVNQDTLLNLASDAHKADWEGYEEKYRTGYSDLPSYQIRYSIEKGDTAFIDFEMEAAPEEIQKLANTLDNLRKKLSWVSTTAY